MTDDLLKSSMHLTFAPCFIPNLLLSGTSSRMSASGIGPTRALIPLLPASSTKPARRTHQRHNAGTAGICHFAPSQRYCRAHQHRYAGRLKLCRPQTRLCDATHKVRTFNKFIDGKQVGVVHRFQHRLKKDPFLTNHLEDPPSICCFNADSSSFRDTIIFSQ